MGARQEGVDFISLAIECQRVCPGLRRHYLHAAHGANINHVDHTGITNGHVEPPKFGVEKNYVRRAAQRDVAEHTARSRLDREQYAGVARAQQPTSPRLEVKTRPCASETSAPATAVSPGI